MCISTFNNKTTGRFHDLFVSCASTHRSSSERCTFAHALTHRHLFKHLQAHASASPYIKSQKYPRVIAAAAAALRSGDIPRPPRTRSIGAHKNRRRLCGDGVVGCGGLMMVACTTTHHDARRSCMLGKVKYKFYFLVFVPCFACAESHADLRARFATAAAAAATRHALQPRPTMATAETTLATTTTTLRWVWCWWWQQCERFPLCDKQLFISRFAASSPSSSPSGCCRAAAPLFGAKATSPIVSVCLCVCRFRVNTSNGAARKLPSRRSPGPAVVIEDMVARFNKRAAMPCAKFTAVSMRVGGK